MNKRDHNKDTVLVLLYRVTSCCVISIAINFNIHLYMSHYEFKTKCYPKSEALVLIKKLIQGIKNIAFKINFYHYITLLHIFCVINTKKNVFFTNEKFHYKKRFSSSTTLV